MNRIIATAAAAFALSFAAIAPAAADTNTTTVMQSVSYADLDLSERGDARTMVQRINRTARSICGDRMSNMSISERYAVRACTRETAGRAVAELDHPMVTAVFERRSSPTNMMLAQR